MHEDFFSKIFHVQKASNLFICLLLEGYELVLLTYLTLVRELATLHRKHLYIIFFISRVLC